MMLCATYSWIVGKNFPALLTRFLTTQSHYWRRTTAKQPSKASTRPRNTFQKFLLSKGPTWTNIQTVKIAVRFLSTRATTHVRKLDNVNSSLTAPRRMGWWRGFHTLLFP